MDTIALFLEPEEEEGDERFSQRRVRERLRGAADRVMELPDEMFLYVLEQMEMATNTKSFSISPKLKLATCLRFFAEGNYQHGVVKDFNICIAHSAFSKLLTEVLNIIERKLCPKWISLTMTEEEKDEAKRYFYAKCGIPGVIMRVDGTHISINTPSASRHLYYNRKGFYSLNAMIICDHKLRIRSVNAKNPGSNHDSFIWNSCAVSTYFQNMYQNGDTNSRLLGNAGYGLFPWLLTPYRGVRPNSPQSKFNEHHSKGRNIVERVIGVLKNRFRCLMRARTMHYTPKKAVQIINVCCALHNICMHFKAFWEEPAEFEDDNSDEYSPAENIQSSQYGNEVVEIRNAIMRSL